jgi:spore coat protein U-like protein
MQMYETLRRVIRLGSFGLAGLVAFAGTASADEAANIAVGVTVTDSCTISSTALTFAGYNAALNVSTPVGANATLSVTCTSGFETAVTLDEGDNPDAGSAPATPIRRMTDGTNFLNYTLNQDAQGGSVVWGDSAGTQAATTGTGAAVAMTVFGQMAAGQNPPAGVYGDVVVATVLF